MSNNPYASYKAPSSNGKFLKLEDGVTVKVRIVGEPVVFQSNFTDQTTGEVKTSTKYAFAVHDREPNFGGAKIIQLPMTAFRMIQDLATGEWGEPQQYDISIKRTGTGLTTEYSIQPLPKSAELTDEEVEAVTLIDLKEVIDSSTFTEHAMYLSEATKSGNAPLESKAQERADLIREQISPENMPL